MIDVTAMPDEQAAAVVERGLLEHALAAGTPPRGELPLFAYSRDESGEVLAGLVGRTVWGWLHVSQLWVTAASRQQGFGSRLLLAAEEEAMRRGCHAAYLDSFDFQAVPFYQRHGYEVFGRLEEFPLGHVRFFLQKRLSGASSAADLPLPPTVLASG